MLNGAGLTGGLRNKVWAECAITTTYLSNILSSKSSLKSPFELLFGSKPILHYELKMISEVGVVTTIDKIQPKLTNRGS
jgi:hypothetical protein